MKAYNVVRFRVKPGRESEFIDKNRDMNGRKMAGFISGTSATGMILNPFIGIPLYGVMHQAPFVVGMVLVMLILAFAVFHPTMQGLTQPAEDFEDEEEGIGFQ